MKNKVIALDLLRQKVRQIDEMKESLEEIIKKIEAGDRSTIETPIQILENFVRSINFSELAHVNRGC